MKDSTRKLTRAALCTAVSTVILALASVLPSGKLALICLAGLSVIIISMSSSWKWAVGTYAAVAFLSLALLPQKLPGLMFAVFAGYYPLVKLAAERMENKPVRWAVKLGTFNAAFLLCYFALLPFIGETAVSELPFAAVLLGGNAVFLIYDYALKELILLYIRKFAGRVK